MGRRRPPHRKNANHFVLAEERNSEEGAVAGDFLTLREEVVRVLEDVGNMRDGAGQDRASGHRADPRRCRMIAHVLREFCRPAQLRLEPEAVAMPKMDIASRRVAQIEHGPD